MLCDVYKHKVAHVLQHWLEAGDAGIAACMGRYREPAALINRLGSFGNAQIADKLNPEGSIAGNSGNSAMVIPERMVNFILGGGVFFFWRPARFFNFFVVRSCFFWSALRCFFISSDRFALVFQHRERFFLSAPRIFFCQHRERFFVFSTANVSFL